MHQVRIALYVALFFLIIPISALIIYGFDKTFWEGVFIELHGMVLDLIVIAVFLFWLQMKSENKKKKENNIQRWKEEIKDYFGWEEKEAVYRVIGNLRRLNNADCNEFSLNGYYFEEAIFNSIKLIRSDLDRINCTGASIHETDFSGSSLIEAIFNHSEITVSNFSQCNLQKAKFKGTVLKDVDFSHADLSGANFIGAKLPDPEFWLKLPTTQIEFKNALLIEADLTSISPEYAPLFFDAFSLYKAQMKPEFKKKIQEKKQQLLKEPNDDLLLKWLRNRAGFI
jgi:hypothetical protein